MDALQLSCFRVTNKRLLLENCPSPTLRAPLRSCGRYDKFIHSFKKTITIKAKPFVSMRLSGDSARIHCYERKAVSKITEDHSKELAAKPHAHQERAVERKGYAKIHDFCFGIPYGGFVFGVGLFGFLFSRNPSSLTTSILGAGILALAAISLKIWRNGLSSMPFMLGQAAIAGALLVKHFQSYLLTKNIFPSAIYFFISAAMLCFYSYVLISGGNPPPKKKASVTPPL